jgi:magnesium transporter
MNFTHMPELDWRYGYGLIVGMMVLIDVAILLRLRKARWL